MNGGAAERGWPFVGREAELAEIEAGQVGVVLVGQAGIGKSRLLAEAVDRVSSAASRTVRVAATESLDDSAMPDAISECVNLVASSGSTGFPKLIVTPSRGVVND